ncbi:MAG TPA: formate dehydrogenase accessory protein FdhE [Actinophytocola sp.]|uniref:formate dehydrogenase accessory protein FdhE domain-containing protein n=1 Tax=Actinophytocola sp. TaxID=1872138 RepID=UPI002DBACE8D|nr:formate dehydrogenase accessory protein FdhE [Actinophytocola sp.]HEU5469145.1 formate dehydrogenase accessory protein FdhE [Actinophytocola sp.]
MTVPRVEASPWAAPGRRAAALRDRHPFAAEMLTLYLALLEVWADADAAARDVPPDALAGWAAGAVLPEVVAATRRHGPAPLAELLPAGNLDGTTELLAAWLAGDELEPVERYLARAALRGPLAAVDAATACAADPAPRGERRCPRCAGPPQLSYRTDSGDTLATGSRRLQCARCAESWSFSSSACAFCGETAGAQRTVFAEQGGGPKVGRREADGATFPHLRIEACGLCQRYLIDVDLGRDPRAVPEVDELAALPLDLYAAEHGYTKITPNLMGF